jgi:sugar lactone lactonase YvrE
MENVTCVLDVHAKVGECPVWCPEEGKLYWVDIGRCTINRFDPATGHNEVCQLPEQIGSFALREQGGIVAALRSGFAFLDFATGHLTAICDPEADKPENRFNDGRCDRAGRFWAGTIRDPGDPTQRPGALYRLGTDLSCSQMVTGVGVSNGLAFSPDGKTMYFADTNRDVQTIWAFDFDLDEGAISNRRVFATTHALPGRPDGACVDADGFYWSANVDGWQLVRFAPDGRVDRTLELPVQKPSMCAFGGEHFAILYITTIGSAGSTPLEPGQPQAGGLFACEPGVRGLPEPKFKG